VTTPRELPTGPDAVVLEIRQEGGIAGPDPVFRSPPDVLITGDGRLVHAEAGAGDAEERTISEAGVRHVVELAGDAGLLADVAYPERTTSPTPSRPSSPSPPAGTRGSTGSTRWATSTGPTPARTGRGWRRS
jgi:hypothetical protein